YRIDIMQPTYFVLPSLDHLYQLTGEEIMAALAEASRLGLYPPRFEVAAGKQAS
ncbi:MAG: phenylalanine 4-monooxygenase, partial [Aeromonas veronii]